jgi:hypothetical protein
MLNLRGDGSTACVSTHRPAPRVARALYALSDFVQSTARADSALCLRTKNLLRAIGNFYGEPSLPLDRLLSPPAF